MLHKCTISADFFDFGLLLDNEASDRVLNAIFLLYASSRVRWYQSVFEFRPGPARAWAGPRIGLGRSDVLGWGPPKVVELVVLTVKLTFLHEIYSNSLFYWLKTPFPFNLIVFTAKKYCFYHGPGRVQGSPGPGRAGTRSDIARAGSGRKFRPGFEHWCQPEHQCSAMLSDYMGALF